MHKAKPMNPWTTKCELATLEFMASDECRPPYGIRPTAAQRIDRLNTWLKHSTTRRWGQPVDLLELRYFARQLIEKLKA